MFQVELTAGSQWCPTAPETLPAGKLHPQTRKISGPPRAQCQDSTACTVHDRGLSSPPSPSRAPNIHKSIPTSLSPFCSRGLHRAAVSVDTERDQPCWVRPGAVQPALETHREPEQICRSRFPAASTQSQRNLCV